MTNKRIVNQAYKRNWKLVNLYYSGVAGIAVIFQVINDLLSIYNIDSLKRIMFFIEIIVLLICLLNGSSFQKRMDSILNKEILSDIFNSLTQLGILVLLVEKTFLELPVMLPCVYNSISVDCYKIIATILLIVFVAICVIIIVIKIQKKSWMYRVDL